MKNKLLALVFIFICVQGFSQNAFYRAQKLLVWRDSIKVLNDDEALGKDTAARKKRQFLDSINAIIFYYGGKEGWNSFLNYPVMNELFKFVSEQSIDRKEVANIFKKASEKSALKKMYKGAYQLLRDIDSLTNLLEINKSNLSRATLNLSSMLKDTSINKSDFTINNKFLADSALLDDEIKKLAKKGNSNETTIEEKTKQFDEIYKLTAFQVALINARGSTVSARVQYDGAGYTTRVKNEIENVTEQTLKEKQESIQPLKNFSFPSQSDIIDALAIYLAKRVKQEMVLAFTDQLKKSLQTDTLLNIFFPETRRIFLSLADYDFPRFGTAWRYAISKDFTQLPDNFYNSNYVSRFFGKDSMYFNDMYQIASLIRKKYTFLDIVEDLSTRQEDYERKDSLQTPAIKKFVNIAHVFNKELFNSNSKTLYWINSSTWAASTEEEFDVFWALVNQKYPEVLQNVSFSKKDSAFGLTSDTKQKVKLWIQRILFAFNKFQENQTELYNASKAHPEKNWEFQVATYWDNFHDIITMVIENNLINESYKNDLARIDITIERLFNVYEAIQQKNYVSAVEETLYMIETFVKVPDFIKRSNWKAILNDDRFRLNAKGKPDPAGKSLMDALSEINVPGYGLAGSAMMVKILDESGTAEERPEVSVIKVDTARFGQPNISAIRALIEKYAAYFEIYKGISLTDQLELLLNSDNPLYARLVKNNPAAVGVVRKAAAIFQDIINASGSQDLSKVIESYALPPGSYKVKRRSSFNIDLNAYFGGYYGVEWTQNENGKYNLKKSGMVFGLSAPVGLSFSWAGFVAPQNTGAGDITLRKTLRRFKGTSHTLSLTVIDIGAVVSYRISNSANKPLPEKLKWGQVLSPGAYYRYGLKGTPLCISLGVQYAPLLRTIDNQSFRNTMRLSAGIMMDLPLFNLYRTL